MTGAYWGKGGRHRLPRDLKAGTGRITPQVRNLQASKQPLKGVWGGDARSRCELSRAHTCVMWKMYWRQVRLMVGNERRCWPELEEWQWGGQELGLPGPLVSTINRTVAAGTGQEEGREAWRPNARLLAWVLHSWWDHRNNSLRS